MKVLKMRQIQKRVKWIACLIGLMLPIWKGYAQEYFQSQLTLGQNIQVSKANINFPHVEPSLVVDPNNPLRLITASMMYTASGQPDQIVSYYSEDGGETWQSSSFQSTEIHGVDPWLAYDNSGVAYLTYLPGVVHKSMDHGKTWSKGVKLKGTKNPYDFIKISSSENYLYVTASQNLRTKAGDRLGPISVVRVSKDLREIEDPVQILPGNINYQVGAPINIHDSDSLAVPFYELSDSDDNLLEQNRIWISMTNNKAKSFLTPKMTGFEGADPVLLADKTDPRKLHLFWQARVDKSWYIHSSYSEDYGVHWSEPIKVEDINRNPGSAGILATVAMSQNGVIGLIWPNHKTDSSNKAYGVYFTYSLDQGKTWSESSLISDKISHPNTKGNEITIKNTDRFVSNRFRQGGDYYGLVSLENNVFRAVWSDNKTGTYQLWTAKIEIKP